MCQKKCNLGTNGFIDYILSRCAFIFSIVIRDTKSSITKFLFNFSKSRASYRNLKKSYTFRDHCYTFSVLYKNFPFVPYYRSLFQEMYTVD